MLHAVACGAVAGRVIRPMVLMVGERLLPVPMNRMHITEHEFDYALRRAGITHRSQVVCVVCESNAEAIPEGSLSEVGAPGAGPC